MDKAVLVTGGAGYIGSHMTHALADRGECVVVLDNLSTGVRKNVNSKSHFVLGDVSDRELVHKIIRSHDIGAVMHFAGSVVVPESMEKPLLYYANNTAASLTLIEECVKNSVKHFVFSSSAAVYGEPVLVPIPEEATTRPTSPYGRSKLMTEQMLQDASRAHDFRFSVLRYFNVAGADLLGRTGQSTPSATHLIKRAVRVALGREPYLEIFGTDFATQDGTGVRDYIHVSDLIDAHLLVLDALRSGAASDVFNCGYRRGVSVLEIVHSIERVTGRQLPTRMASRRVGDISKMVADPSKLKRLLGWKSKYDDVDLIVRSALDWERGL